MEANPYAAPAAAIHDVAAWDALDLEGRKSSRGKRLGAVLLDGVINVTWLAPIIFGAMMSDGVQKGIKPAAPMLGLMLLGLILALCLLVFNCVMVHRRGQTLGKRALGVAMARTDGNRVRLRRYLFLRLLPVSILGAVPVVGGLVSLINPLMIFGKQRRGLHDLIADTIVVDV